MALALAALLIAGGLFLGAPVFAGGNSITVDSKATTTGSTITVSVKANATKPMSAAGAAVNFDATRLKLTGIAKAADVVADGVSYAGFPGSSSLTSFLATANTNGTIPTIGWTFTDGDATTYGGAIAAGTNAGIVDLTFQVLACGNSTIDPVVVPGVGGILDGTGFYGPSTPPTTYGDSLTVNTLVSGSITNPCPSPTSCPTVASTSTPSSPTPDPCATPVPAANNLSIVPPTGAAVGGTFTVQILEHSSVAISGVQASLTFDRSLLQITSITRGTAWADAPWYMGATAGNVAIANGYGWLGTVAAAFLPPDNVSAGDQVFLNVTFQAISCGHADLGLPVGPLDAAMIDGRPNIDDNHIVYGNNVPVSATGTSFDVSCTAGPTPTASVTGATNQPTGTPTPTPSLSGSPSPTPSEPNYYWLTPAPANAMIGGYFTIQVKEHNSVAAAGVAVTVNFDKTRLQVTDLTWGPAWGAAPVRIPGRTPVPQTFLDTANANGSLKQVAATFASPDNVAAGENVVLNVTFKALTCGQTTLGMPVGPFDAQMTDGRPNPNDNDIIYGRFMTVSAAGITFSVACSQATPTPRPTPTRRPTRPPTRPATKSVAPAATDTAVDTPAASDDTALPVQTPTPTPAPLVPAAAGTGSGDNGSTFAMLLLIPLYAWAVALLAIRRYGLPGRVRGWNSPTAW